MSVWSGIFAAAHHNCRRRGEFDKTSPTVTLATAALSYRVDQRINVTCMASDALSGIASHTCSTTAVTNIPAYTFGVGAETLSASATDLAGNTAKASITFSVVATPGSLCALTKQFVQSSSKYQALAPGQKTGIDKLADALCSTLAAIVPKLRPDQKARLVAAYVKSVVELSTQGWLTGQQAMILRDLSAGL